MCKNKLVHNEEEYRISESFLNKIADICHTRDVRNTKIKASDWDVCSRLFTDFVREVNLKFGVDLTEKYIKEREDDE